MKRLFFLFFLLQVMVAGAQTTSRIVMRWGVDLSTRLDTLSPLFCDTIRMNGHTFKLVTDSAYNWNFYPRVYSQMLLFADKSGNVQNIAVTSYSFSRFTGLIQKTSSSNNRELWSPCMSILNSKIGETVTITNVVCQDLSGNKMLVKVPVFKLMKIR